MNITLNITLLEYIQFILLFAFGILSMGTILYSIITIKNNKKSVNKNIFLSFTFLTLCFIISLSYYSKMNDFSALYDVGDVLQRVGFILWVLIVLSNFIYIKMAKGNINFLFSNIFSSLSVYLTQYYISSKMLINSSNTLASFNLHIVLISIIILLVILLQYILLKNLKK